MLAGHIARKPGAFPNVVVGNASAVRAAVVARQQANVRAAVDQNVRHRHDSAGEDLPAVEIAADASYILGLFAFHMNRTANKAVFNDAAIALRAGHAAASAIFASFAKDNYICIDKAVASNADIAVIILFDLACEAANGLLLANDGAGYDTIIHIAINRARQQPSRGFGVHRHIQQCEIADITFAKIVPNVAEEAGILTAPAFNAKVADAMTLPIKNAKEGAFCIVRVLAVLAGFRSDGRHIPFHLFAGFAGDFCADFLHQRRHIQISGQDVVALAWCIGYTVAIRVFGLPQAAQIEQLLRRGDLILFGCGVIVRQLRAKRHELVDLPIILFIPGIIRGRRRKASHQAP